jgi:DivIVA domain-containing protein
MNVTPLDLRQQKFTSVFRGFDKIEVTSLLMAAADDYEQALRETDRLRQDLTKLDVVLAEYRDHEKLLHTTLLAAQKLADDITSNAEAESRRIIGEAQGRSELLLGQSQARLEAIQHEIDGLKLRRRDVETSIEATIQTLRHTLDLVREQDVRDREDRPRVSRPHGDAGQSERRFATSASPAPALARLSASLEPPGERVP